MFYESIFCYFKTLNKNVIFCSFTCIHSEFNTLSINVQYTHPKIPLVERINTFYLTLQTSSFIKTMKVKLKNAKMDFPTAKTWDLLRRILAWSTANQLKNFGQNSRQREVSLSPSFDSFDACSLFYPFPFLLRISSSLILIVESLIKYHLE